VISTSNATGFRAVPTGYAVCMTPHRVNSRSRGRHGPVNHELSIDAVRFDAGAGERIEPLLTVAQRRRLMALATRVRLPPRTIIYRKGNPLSDIFIVGEGLVKSFRDLASGRRRIVAFLFPRDVFGLAETGRYVNTTQTITESLIYSIPFETLNAALQRDAELQFRFLCKVTEKLREAQRHAIVLGRRDAVGRLAMFFKMLEADRTGRHHNGLIPLPMRRTDIAEYLGLSAEAVSRAARLMAVRKIVAFVGHAFRVKDRSGFDSLVAAA
jgi:CRP-like cAMP-binding protein